MKKPLGILTPPVNSLKKKEKVGHFLKLRGMPLRVTQGDQVAYTRAPATGLPFADKLSWMFLSVAHSPFPPQQQQAVRGPKCYLHHRITWVGRDLRRSPVQPPLKAGSALRSDHVTQGLVKT